MRGRGVRRTFQEYIVSPVRPNRVSRNVTSLRWIRKVKAYVYFDLLSVGIFDGRVIGIYPHVLHELRYQTVQ